MLRHLSLGLAILVLIVLAAGSPGRAAAQSPTDEPDFAIPGGRFYTQASGRPGRGFAVTDEGGALFWTEFQRLGGVQAVGYPISGRFEWDGFPSQAFQKMIFQWRANEGRVFAVNVLDVMSERGLDPWLLTVRSTPPSADWSADQSRSWPEVVTAHQALLTDNDIGAAYFAVRDPVIIYGLPMAPIRDLGGVLVLRMQRGILQKWLTDRPWARAGQVTVANSGDLAKEAGLLPAAALEPAASPRTGAGSASTAPLRAVLDASPATTSGDPVRLTLRVTNVGAGTLRWFTGLPVADFSVSRDGRELWRWSAGKVFAAIAEEVELGPGASAEYAQTWPLVDAAGARMPPGDYQATGFLTSGPRPRADDTGEPAPVRSAPVTITVR